MKKVIFSFLTTGFMLTIIGGYALTPYAAEIPTESEVLATVTTKPATTDSTTNDLTVFKDSFSSDESDEGSFVYDFITANDNAFPTDTIFYEYNLVTELGNDGCWINFDLASGVFSMSGRDTQSFSIFGSFERKGNDLYLYPENASAEFYVLHRKDDHFVSQSEEKGVNLTEGLVFYADNDAFWGILPDQAHSENESTDTGDTSTTKSNIASDDELAQWAINDYQDKTGITAASAEVRTVSDEEYAIAIKDSDGNILDTYIINPETGVGTNSSNKEVDLPQTGVSSTHKAFAGLAALMTLTGAVLVKKSEKEDNDQ